MGIVSRLRGSLCWAVFWQLLATNLLVVAVEYMSRRSGASEETCRRPSLAWSVLAVFSRTLAAVMGVSYQECVLQQLRRHLLKAVVVDAFVLFLRLRSLYNFLRLCIGAILKPLEEEDTLEIKEPSLPKEENRLEEHQTSPSEVGLQTRQPFAPDGKSSPQHKHESQPREDDNGPELSIVLDSSQATATSRSPPSTNHAAGDGGITPRQSTMEPQLPEMNQYWKIPTQHADATEQYAGMTPHDSEITPCLELTPQLAGTTPKRGEMMPIWELTPNDEMTPEDDEMTSEDDEMTSEDDEMTPEDDELTPQYEEGAPQDHGMAPQYKEIIPFWKMLPLWKFSPQHSETTPQKAEVTPEHAEMAQFWDMAPQQGELTPQHNEATPQEAETTPQNKDATPQQAEMASQHSANSQSDSSSSS